MLDYLPHDPFTRRHVGPHNAFLVRTNAEHVAIARAAVALRLDVPVGEIEVEWPWQEQPAGKVVPIKRRAAA